MLVKEKSARRLLLMFTYKPKTNLRSPQRYTFSFREIFPERCSVSSSCAL